MKRQVLLSLVAAAVIFAVSSTSAHAGMFGRLGHVFHRGCGPCTPACEPCQPACDPCEQACGPCDTACDTGCGAGYCRPFRPFGGFFVRLKARMAYKHCNPCGPCESACEPCEPACEPCQPACDPCEAACDPCGATCARPFRPFGGFFAKWKYRTKCGDCSPCGPCDPCDPCGACK